MICLVGLRQIKDLGNLITKWMDPNLNPIELMPSASDPTDFRYFKDNNTSQEERLMNGIEVLQRGV